MQERVDSAAGKPVDCGAAPAGVAVDQEKAKESVKVAVRESSVEVIQ